MKRFYPKMYKKNIYDINYDKLKELGIKCLVFDLYNTIALIDQDYVDSRTKTLFKDLIDKFIVVIVSNNTSKKRVGKYGEILSCDFVYNAMKPSRKSLRKIMRKYKLDCHEIAVIGDQLVTDIQMSTRNKSYPILVDPMGRKDLKITSLNRFIERQILKNYKKKNIFSKGEYYE